MRFGFKQPLVGEKRCVTTLITAAEETTIEWNLKKNLYIDLGQPKSVAPGPGCSEPD